MQVNLADIEDAEMKLAKLQAKNAETREMIAKLTAIQEQTDIVISTIQRQIVNMRIEYERTKQ
jgi:hypothetical protein